MESEVKVAQRHCQNSLEVDLLRNRVAQANQAAIGALAPKRAVPVMKKKLITRTCQLKRSMYFLRRRSVKSMSLFSARWLTWQIHTRARNRRRRESCSSRWRCRTSERKCLSWRRLKTVRHHSMKSCLRIPLSTSTTCAFFNRLVFKKPLQRKS